MPNTPLHEIHQALGATLTDFAGWSMPLRYGSETAEHHAVRTAAGLFDISHMGEIVVTGPEAGQALDWALVGEPTAMPVGKARYTMIVAADGGIIDDLIVYRLTTEQYLVVANAGNAAVVAAELMSRTAGFDVVTTDASADWALIAVQGPVAAAIVAQVTASDVSGLKYYAIDPAQIDGRDVLLARTGYTGEDGFEVFCAAADAVRIWGLLTAAGADRGLVPAGLSCRDSLRLEAGMPLYGHELTRELTPYDVGLGRVVKLGKPAGFVGSEALLAASAKVSDRQLIGLRGLSRRSPRAGQVVIDPANSDPNGSGIGVVTSGAPSPTLGYPIAMALVSGRDPRQPGTRLQVDVRGRTEEVEVVALPFYRRQR